MYNSKIISVSNLFFQTFCDKILIFLIIMLDYHTWLSKLIVSWLLEVLNISSNTTLYWDNVFRKNMSLNQLGDLLYNLNTWMNESMVCSVWFPIRRIHLEVHLVIPSKLAMVFSFITLDIFQILSLASKHCMLLFLAVFVLRC